MSTNEPPGDLDAERAVLAAALIGHGSTDGLTVEDFYAPQNQLIYGAIRALEGDGFGVDVVTIADRLRGDGRLDEVGGIEALNELANLTPSLSLTPQHASIIRQHAWRRRLVLGAADLGQAALSGDEGRIAQAFDRLVEDRADSHDVDPSFLPVDLAALLDDDLAPIEPSILRRDDAQCLLYVGQVNGVHGDSGVGKGWLALVAVEQQITAGRAVLYLDTEDGPDSILGRLQQLGARRQAIVDGLTYARPTAAFDEPALAYLAALIEARRPSLVVIDSLGECFGIEGIDEDRDAEVGPWLRRVARRFADLGPAVLLVDHSTKAKDNRLYPSGSKRKRAAIGGASYYLDAAVPFTRERGGRLRIECAKDRHGYYARGEHVGDLVMTVDALGCRTTLYVPDAPSDSDDRRVIAAARAAVEACKVEGRPLSQREVLALMPYKGSREDKKTGIDIAVGRGALDRTTGPNRALLHSYACDLPNEVDDP